MERDRSTWLAFALLALVTLAWAGNSIVGRAIRYDVPPFALAFGRWTLALLIVMPFAVRPILRDRDQIMRHWKVLLALGVLGVAAFNSFLYTGLRHTTATNALLLQAGIPALVVLLDRIMFGVRSSLMQIAGIASSVVGVMAIVFKGDAVSALRLQFGSGDLLILGAVLVWSLYTVLLKLRPAIAPVSLVAVTFAIGAVIVAPMAAWEWHAGERVVWSARAVGAYIYVAVFPSIAAYFIYNWASAKVGAARAGLAITMMPLFGALLSAGLLGEQLASYHYAGMALILLGIVLGVLAPRLQDTAGARQRAPLEDSA